MPLPLWRIRRLGAASASVAIGAHRPMPDQTPAQQRIASLEFVAVVIADDTTKFAAQFPQHVQDESVFVEMAAA